MHGAHLRRQSERRTGMVGLGATAVLVALALTLVVWRGALGAGPDTAAAAPAAASEHSDHVAAVTQVDATKAPSSGPITDLDKQLLVKVRQADLWELPAGRLAQENASLDQVKRAGLHLMEGHSRLDQMVREIAASLGVAIPDKPTADQQSWLHTLRTTRGTEFDRFFANQLRNSHGKVFVVIAKVRATTQNSVIRDLAIEADRTVADHLEVMEDTGLVEPKTLQDVAADVLP
jgi:predicted outer membrane protein